MTEAGPPALLGRVGAIVSEALVGTGLLFYFGWIRTQSTFAYFGVDVSLLGFATADYVLRSLNAAVVPAVLAIMLLLLLHTVHRRVVQPVVRNGHPFTGVVLAAASATGAVLLTLAAVGTVTQIITSRSLGLVLPIALLTGAALLAYLGFLRQDRDSLRKVLLITLTFAGLLWTLTRFAEQTGERVATGVAMDLSARPSVTLYSVDRLAIAGPGVAVDPITQPDSKYRFRYSGLQALAHTKDNHVLLPAQWKKGRDSVYVIPVGEVRIDITGG
ncbi:hypothetical protein [Amycolatopsis albispora]|uniref:Uncharacterized protein n=1 Tax=Amycolatopsis albispora TaxID=1804986 RepID=A0A344L239_9PSEU|nr:hypothetical protein [Amycolatopsis albispora]AXB42113.1 hypothetical protein A4R43_05870 [Amycolatopsis albispora]